MIRASRVTGRTPSKRTSLGRARSKKVSRIKTPISTWKNGRSPIPTSQQRLDAFATDDILLYGLVARHNVPDKFRVAGDYAMYRNGERLPTGEKLKIAISPYSRKCSRR